MDWMGDTPQTVMSTRAPAVVKRLRVDIYSHTGRTSHIVRTIIATCGRKVGKHENILMLLRPGSGHEEW